jgi:hypothetical protein
VLLAILFVIVALVALVVLRVLPGAIIWILVGALALSQLMFMSKRRSSTGLDNVSRTDADSQGHGGRHSHSFRDSGSGSSHGGGGHGGGGHGGGGHGGGGHGGDSGVG